MPQDCVAGLFRAIMISGVVFYLAAIFLYKDPISSPPEGVLISPEGAAELSGKNESPTNISHLLFGLIGSEKTWHYRKAYTESWWRPGVTRGYLYLDVAPTGDLLPWSPSSPPYRVSDDISRMVKETKHVAPVMARMVHGIMEVFRERHEGVRWVVMGDDDSVFFVENMVDVLARYDHTKYYYLGAPSEFVNSNHWLSFNQAFGGAGIILSYPLAEALSNDMDSCLSRYAHIVSADHITMLCISDLGVNLSPLKGIHQVDIRGDLSGFLSAHPKFPLLSLHHLDNVDPIFPAMDRFESVKHLVRTANYDQTRMLQQNICYRRQSNWSVSVSWGYSVHIYEKIHRRSYLQLPIETFKPWGVEPLHLPIYMFNTRLPSKDPCEVPHVFFLKTVKRTEDDGIVMTYLRSSERGLSACSFSGNHSAGYVSRIEVYSPSTKRPEVDIRGTYLVFCRPSQISHCYPSSSRRGKEPIFSGPWTDSNPLKHFAESPNYDQTRSAAEHLLPPNKADCRFCVVGLFRFTVYEENSAPELPAVCPSKRSTPGLGDPITLTYPLYVQHSPSFYGSLRSAMFLP
nr:uncharacterized protein LOC109154389 [Ipomoea batatas]